MGLKPIQVRKDISITGIIGKPKIGYEVDVLLAHLDDFMGWNTHTKAVIAGCGNLGLSLINYKDFDRYGFDIVAGFDIDGKKIGTKTNNKPIYSIEQLSSYIKKNNIEIGIITVSEKDAQKIANVFVENGIRAIWNFAPVTLALPDNVAIQQQDMSPSLAVLIKKLIYHEIVQIKNNKKIRR